MAIETTLLQWITSKATEVEFLLQECPTTSWVCLQIQVQTPGKDQRRNLRWCLSAQIMPVSTRSWTKKTTKLEAMTVLMLRLTRSWHSLKTLSISSARSLSVRTKRRVSSLNSNGFQRQASPSKTPAVRSVISFAKKTRNSWSRKTTQERQHGSCLSLFWHYTTPFSSRSSSASRLS